MENINNIEKMTAFIYHEAKEKANEILIKAHEEYNLEKAKIVLLESEKIEKEMIKKVKEINTEFNTKTSEIRNKYKMKIMEKRAAIIDCLLAEVSEELKKSTYSDELVKEALLTIKEDNLVLYVDGDYRNVIKETGLNVEIRRGNGLVVESVDGKSRCDNSFRARVEVFRKNHLDFLAKELFKQIK